MKKIGEVIDAFYKSHDLFKKEKKISLFQVWGDVVGDHIAQKTKKIIIKNNILIVSVSHPIIKNELTYSKAKIMKEIKSKYKEISFTDLKIL